MTATASRLGRLARATQRAAAARQERCELCAQPIPSEHRHVLDLRSGDMQCVCRPCALLFDRDGAQSGHLRTVTERRMTLDGLPLDEQRWAALGVPVDMAFLVRSSLDGRVRVRYPSPAGATEAALDAAAWWQELADEDPRLPALADDVEALLVDRVRGRRRFLAIPIDDAYRLVALVRTQWRGITGGTPMWRALDDFLDDLSGAARPAPEPAATPPAGGRKEATWPA